MVCALDQALPGLRRLVQSGRSGQKSDASTRGLTVLSPTDIELVANIQNGQSEAEGALYEKYSAKVYYLALRDSKSSYDAEDVRAETFLRLIQAIRRNQIRSADALPAFILGVTRNVLHELYARRNQAGDVVEPSPEHLSSPSHERMLLDHEVRIAVQKTIDRLKPRERAVLRMHFYEELPTNEIAARTAIAPERVRLVKSRALKHFREIHERLKSAAKRDF
jgi:RNA polymerase sigma factor (sigma-70 family)